MSIHSSPSPNNFDAANAFRLNQMEITACGTKCSSLDATHTVRTAAVEAAQEVNDFTKTLHTLGDIARNSLPAGVAAVTAVATFAGSVSPTVAAAGAFAGAIASFLPHKGGNGRG